MTKIVPGSRAKTDNLFAGSILLEQLSIFFQIEVLEFRIPVSRRLQCGAA